MQYKAVVEGAVRRGSEYGSVCRREYVLDWMYSGPTNGNDPEQAKVEVHCAMRMSVHGVGEELAGDHGHSGLAPEV